MKLGARILGLFLLAVLGAAGQYAQAATYNVNCSKNEHIGKALRVLASANPQGPNTINVTGVCHGNFVIQSMDRLTLITNNGAALTDRSSGSLAVVDIEDSHSVTVKGFTINGFVQCGAASVCYLTGNTVEAGGVGVGGGSHAFLESNVIQDGAGSNVSDGSQMFSSNDVFQNNAGVGIVAGAGTYFEATNISLLNNGVGILAAGSNLFFHGGTISGSTGNGMTVLAGTTVVFRDGTTITGNGAIGVHLEDASFAGFQSATVTGNLSGLDVDCAPQFTITHFVARTGGVTNCVESASKSKPKTVE
jgi:hypothetical protein